MNYKQLKSAYKAAKEMKEHYKDLYTTVVTEHIFQCMQVGALESLIEEIHTISDEELVKAIIENGKNRRELDKIIHAKKIFNV